MTSPVAATPIGAVFSDVVGQPAALSVCGRAVEAAAAGPGAVGAAMTHSWLFTGPPGSGRSVLARAFAAALQCDSGGCGQCQSCRSVMAGTHSDVLVVNTEGLSIKIEVVRSIVQRSASAPSVGRWQIVLVEDADRLGERAFNVLLKAIEEPSPHTVFLLCAPSAHPDDVPVTIRSRCRVINLVSPSAAAIAHVLIDRDGIDAQQAKWAAAVCAGHVGRARALARNPQAREQRERLLEIPTSLRRFKDVFFYAAELLAAAKQRADERADALDATELAELKTAMGAGGTGKGAAGATRGMAGAIKDLENRQKARKTRTTRDVLDSALMDLSGFYRDVLTVASGAKVDLLNPDIVQRINQAASLLGAAGALERIDHVLACRVALARNVKPDIAIENLMMQLRLPS